MRIDAHQHFWNYDAAAYPWIGPGTPLQRNWLPEDLAACAGPLGFEGSVAVQARQSLEESNWLLQLADQSQFIRGVVGWVDLQSENVVADLATLSRHRKFVGVRHVVQAEADSNFMLRPEFLRGLGLLGQFDLTYDLLVFPKQLPAAITVARQFPDEPFVLDHIAKPVVRAGLMQPWKSDIRELAAQTNVQCKISGLVTEGKIPGWQEQDFRPYLDVIVEAFGPERLMFGSDWPVCLLGGSYADSYELVANYFGQFTSEIRENIFGGNATRFYGLS